MRLTLGFCLFVLLQVSTSVVQAEQPAPASPTKSAEVPANDAIDFAGFVLLSKEMQEVREARRIAVAEFLKMADDPQTIVLDTRSKWAFDVVHVSGAVHLNFSDFTADKLAQLIPDKSTRVLIYCNNNFREPSEDRTSGDSAAAPRKDLAKAVMNKAPRLALNIPTFITLHGYGYKNVYELADQLDLNDKRWKLEGTFDDQASATD